MKGLSIFFLLLVALNLVAKSQDYVQVKDGHFTSKGSPWYFVGANYWYGSYLGLNKDPKRGIERLRKELDFLKAKGVTNLRVLAAVEGSGQINGVQRVAPAYQVKKGVFDDQQLKGLDLLLAELGKRGMTAVLFLSNNWEWSGGFLQYLNWNGGISDSIMRRKLSWDEQRDYTSKFYSCQPCMDSYYQQVRSIVGRTNKITGKKYSADPVIMAWELGNEPRPMRPAADIKYAEWIAKSASLIKSLDPNHLVTIGHEGDMATDGDTDLFTRIHADKNVDYLTIHIWPKNWGWFKQETMANDYPVVTEKTLSYITKHAAVATKLHKPLVVEEFGLPRDGHTFTPGSTTTLRDQYYTTILESLKQSQAAGGSIGGINFWAFAGSARPVKGQTFWKAGDDYMGDPPMEEQGLNGVFDSDSSTWRIISKYALPSANTKQQGTANTSATAQTKNLFANLKTTAAKGVMFGHQDDLAYGVGWKYVPGKSDVKELVNDYPAVYGWELGNLELGMAHNLDSVPFTAMKSFIKQVYDRGGVNTISWHFTNPVSMKNAWDTTHGAVQSIVPGGANNGLYNQWLDRLAAFMLDLKGSDGKPVPVLFRPFHELTGNWFWWCKNTNSPVEFKQLWRYTFQYLQNKGVNNLLYVYNTADFKMGSDFMERYPGDDVVDMISFDAYQYGDPRTGSGFETDVDKRLGIIGAIAAERGKLFSLAEAGYERVPYDRWFTNTLWNAIGKHQLSYVLLWRNAGLQSNGNWHYYVPKKGDVAEADFIKFYSMDKTLFQEDVSKLNLYK